MTVVRPFIYDNGAKRAMCANMDKIIINHLENQKLEFRISDDGGTKTNDIYSSSVCDALLISGIATKTGEGLEATNFGKLKISKLSDTIVINSYVLNNMIMKEAQKAYDGKLRKLLILLSVSKPYNLDIKFDRYTVNTRYGTKEIQYNFSVLNTKECNIDISSIYKYLRNLGVLDLQLGYSSDVNPNKVSGKFGTPSLSFDISKYNNILSEIEKH